MRSITIAENDAGQRLDKFLSKRFRSMPSSLLHKYLRKKCVRLNGVHASGNEFLTVNDTLQLYISDEFFEQSPQEHAFLRVKPALSVAYEDDNLLIVSKPAGLVVHEDENEQFNTLINQIKAYLYAAGSYDPASENSFAPALCNRIDRNTEGLVIAAKNAASLRAMNAIIKNRRLDKRYLAVIHGSPAKKSDLIESYLRKDAENNIVRLTNKKLSASDKTALTRYTVLAERNGLSLVELELITGRTHQIRAHMAGIGHPLLGDGKYGHRVQSAKDRKNGFSSQALCAYSLQFIPEAGDEPLLYLKGMTIKAPPPEFLELFPEYRA